MHTGVEAFGIARLHEATDRDTTVDSTFVYRARTTMLIITRKMRTAAQFAFALLTGPF